MSTSTRSPRTKRKAFSRRTLLQASALGLSGMALSKAAFAQTVGGYQPPDSSPDLDDSNEIEPLGVTQTYPLVNRMTFGTNLSEVALFNKLGWDGYVEYHLAPEKIVDTSLDSRLREFASINATPYQCIKIYTWQNGFDIYYDVSSAQITRATYAKAQFLEVMTEFWLDHFNIHNNL